ncbi:hypothetical protein KUO10_23500, partial [Vibrio vulnificus]|nr:hypothetical protein [Vibrio vulnificus]
PCFTLEEKLAKREVFVLEEYNGSTKPCFLRCFLSQSFSQGVIRLEGKLIFFSVISLFLRLLPESLLCRIKILLKDNFVSFIISGIFSILSYQDLR